MKKYIMVGAFSIWITGGAYAADNCCQCIWTIDDTRLYAPECTQNSFCLGCSGQIVSTIINGVCTPSCIGGNCEPNQYKNLRECIDCPDGGTTGSNIGGDAITDCYLPAGTTRSDETGTYKYTDKCYYSLID